MWENTLASTLLRTVLLIVVPLLTEVGALVLPSTEDTIAQVAQQRTHLLHQGITDHLLHQGITDHLPSHTDLVIPHHPTIIMEGSTTLTQAGLIVPLVPDAFALLAAALLGLVLYAELEPIIKRVQARQEHIDLRIPYDAAAQLAYEKSDKSLRYDEFKAKFEADAVADVIAKRKSSTSASKVTEKSGKVDNSFGILGSFLRRNSRDDIVEKTEPTVTEVQTEKASPPKSNSIGTEKKKLDAESAVAKARALASAIASNKRDRSITSDTAVKLDYAARDKIMSSKEFKLQYEAGAVADRKAETADVKVPYNAAARLAFESEGYAGSIAFQEFEKLYVKKAVAKATAKKRERDAAAAVVKAQKEAASAVVELQWLRDAQREVSDADAALRSILKSRE